MFVIKHNPKAQRMIMNENSLIIQLENNHCYTQSATHC